MEARMASSELKSLAMAASFLNGLPCCLTSTSSMTHRHSFCDEAIDMQVVRHNHTHPQPLHQALQPMQHGMRVIFVHVAHLHHVSLTQVHRHQHWALLSPT